MMRVPEKSWRGSEPIDHGSGLMAEAEEARDQGLRKQIAGLLASGLQTRTEPVPEDTLDVQKVVLELQNVPPDDIENKLVVAGVINQPRGEEGLRCKECMYYLIHRRWCELPELDIPVGANWWCRLWRI